MDTYKSIKNSSEGLYKDLGSRFIAFAIPVENEAEAKTHLDSLRKEYHDARHCCYAYRIGLDGSVFRSSDDGEPSGSAGRPILGQIDSAGLSDILIVVVRYFGGIKLGVPGLIRAYRAASADALANSVIIEKTAARLYRVHFGYLSMNAVMKLTKDFSLPVSEQDFGENCSMVIRVRLSQEEDFLKRILDIDNCEAESLD